MTTDAITADLHEPPPLFCYRHPDRETWVRCGRCDQPICTRCAMQGPVGLRCRTCGKPSRDALTSLKPNQIAIGPRRRHGTRRRRRLLRGTVRVLDDRHRLLRWDVDREALDRTIGIKRGPQIITIAVAGVVVGSLIGAGFSLIGTWREFQAFASSAEASGMPVYTLDAFLFDNVPAVLIALIATIAGVYARLR